MQKPPKPAKNETPYQYPTHANVDDELQLVSTSSGISDHEDHEFPDSSARTCEKEVKDENAFIGFLGELSSVEFDLPMCCALEDWADSSGITEDPEVVRHCLCMFFTHINFQQYHFTPLESVLM